jgi:hypothetical protein
LKWQSEIQFRSQRNSRREVWQLRNPNAADHLVSEDFTVTSGGVDIRSREAFKKWVAAFLSSIDDFEFNLIETFQNETGDRVVRAGRRSI